MVKASADPTTLAGKIEYRTGALSPQQDFQTALCQF